MNPIKNLKLQWKHLNVNTLTVCDKVEQVPNNK